ncbi:aldehyde dehydrogenase [Lysobacter concretionis Ko07 = DSM 16239]|jgi:acyl-CoA reductase-like NAD-dependent aldehyde dehydrogenase|uniref:Aldehyde dehydrogenase n=1 Tax=Lysobacter concretionis Ko07 = DSM 16239 TaxID=1122185 RepID=A0A0A0ETD6_9GAMM|nr:MULTISPECIES: aldehyde dehydrogenase family protein [Lysobacter]KGM52397.1 aldehyde dehydrogenase [Lysobacter concretionis Ko07 = DSM 16239]QOD91861.1 aldehyde dehydrogenase family protein [Lysobacter sp. CW239]
MPALKKSYPYYLAGAALRENADLVVLDKYSGKPATRVAMADADAVQAAIAAAHGSRGAMAAFPPDARRAVLEHCVRRFGERHEELAQTLCIEAGKPIRDARGEVSRLIDTFRIAADEATRIGGEVIELQISARTRGYRGMTRRVPVGVCSFITPFNFPLNLVAHKVAPAIAAGCPFVLKPAAKTPIGALIIAEVLAETDLPKGAFSVMPCSNEDAAPLVEDERIALLSFTGGLVGWDLKARAGRKKVVLELGGNAACIVDADPGADLDAVVGRLVSGAYYQSGQSCISVQRIHAHVDIYDRLRRKLKAAIGKLQVGDPRDEATFIGPMIDEDAARRVEDWIAAARKAGAKKLAGGPRTGNLLPAWLLEGVPRDADLYRREAFGPVALMEPFEHFDDALDAVNDSDFGLQAGVFTARLDHAMRAWDRLEVGGVIVGDIPSFRVDNMPYGGVKHSGLGREGVRYAIEDMTEPRLLVIRDPQ